MLTNMQKSAFVIVAGIVAMLVYGPYPASAGEEMGTGIWTYNHRWTIALINLTDYPLTYVRDNEPGAYPYPVAVNDTNACGGENPVLWVSNDLNLIGRDWQVDPYRSKVWNGFPGCNISPVYYDGKITLYSTGFPDWKFDLVFVSQAAKGVAERGNWIGLSPHATGQGWRAYNSTDPNSNWAYGRWVTPVDDGKMHNIMTLIGPKVMVALYSGNNHNLIVVVQQLIAEDASGVVWNDTGDVYRAYYLDFVDNDATSVPGQ